MRRDDMTLFRQLLDFATFVYLLQTASASPTRWQMRTKAVFNRAQLSAP